MCSGRLDEQREAYYQLEPRRLHPLDNNYGPRGDQTSQSPTCRRFESARLHSIRQAAPSRGTSALTCRRVGLSRTRRAVVPLEFGGQVGASCVRCAYAASWSWARTTTCAACGAEEPPRTVIRKLNERFTECELGSKMPRELIESGEA